VAKILATQARKIWDWCCLNGKCPPLDPLKQHRTHCTRILQSTAPYREDRSRKCRQLLNGSILGNVLVPGVKLSISTDTLYRFLLWFKMSEFVINSSIQCFHIYKSLWTPGKSSPLFRRWHSTCDHFAVGVHKDRPNVGYVPASSTGAFLKQGTQSTVIGAIQNLKKVLLVFNQHALPSNTLANIIQFLQLQGGWLHVQLGAYNKHLLSQSALLSLLV